MNFVRVRAETCWTQKDFAFEAGLHRTFVGHLERQKRNPKLGLECLAAARRCQWLNCSCCSGATNPLISAHLIRQMRRPRPMQTSGTDAYSSPFTSRRHQLSVSTREFPALAPFHGEWELVLLGPPLGLGAKPRRRRVTKDIYAPIGSLFDQIEAVPFSTRKLGNVRRSAGRPLQKWNASSTRSAPR